VVVTVYLDNTQYCYKVLSKFFQNHPKVAISDISSGKRDKNSTCQDIASLKTNTSMAIALIFYQDFLAI
jgi:hypothetical protein